jgi:hypothetical protein
MLLTWYLDETLYPLLFKHETKFVQYAAKEMERFEQKCQQLLIDSRPEAGGDETTIESQFPEQLLSLFGRITIFFLCAFLAVSQHARYKSICRVARSVSRRASLKDIIASDRTQ